MKLLPALAGAAATLALAACDAGTSTSGGVSSE